MQVVVRRQWWLPRWHTLTPATGQHHLSFSSVANGRDEDDSMHSKPRASNSSSSRWAAQYQMERRSNRLEQKNNIPSNNNNRRDNVQSPPEPNNKYLSSNPPTNWSNESYPRGGPPRRDHQPHKMRNNNNNHHTIGREINQCRTIEDVIQVLSNNDTETDRDTSITPIAWKKISSLLSSNSNSSSRHSSFNSNTRDHNYIVRHGLDVLYQQTLYDMQHKSYDPVQLSNIAQSCASIVKAVTTNNNRRGGGQRPTEEQTILYNQFVKSTKFWEMLIYDTSSYNLDEFRPKWLVSIAWSFATILNPINRHQQKYDGNGGSSNSNKLDVSPFFHALHTSYNKRRNDFTSKHMGNLAWSNMMTCRDTKLFSDFAIEFIHRSSRKRDNYSDNNRDSLLDPISICQWANAYAKAKHLDKELFQIISNAAIRMLPLFESRHFANLAYAFALAGENPPGKEVEDNNGSTTAATLYDEISREAIHRISTFDSQNMANIVWAYAKMEHYNSTAFVDTLAKEAIPRLKEFTPQQLANLAWAYSKFPSSSLEHHNDIFDHIVIELGRRGGLNHFTSQGLAMLAHSFATVGHTKNTKFWDMIEVDASSPNRLSQLGPIECSQLAWSFATIGRASDKLFHGIESVVRKKMAYIKPLGLSNLAWSFAMLGYDSPKLFDDIVRESFQRIHELLPQDKAMLVLALSRINHSCPELYEQIAATSLSNLNKFSSLDLFNLVVCYSKVGYVSEPWMEAIAKEVVRRPPGSNNPKNLVGIAWAYANIGCHSPQLFNLIADECINHCNTLETKEISSLTWSFAALECYHRPIFEELAATSCGRWNEFDAPSLANMAWSYSTKSLHMHSSKRSEEDQPQLFEGVINAAINKRDEFTSPQSVSMLLWSCSAAGHLDQRLFDAFAPIITTLLHDICKCNSQTLANIAWAYAVANVNDKSLFGPNSQFIDVIIEKSDEFDIQGLCQLHQWQLWQKELKCDVQLPSSFQNQCYNAFISQELKGSKFQDAVISELSSIGLELKLEEEVLTTSGYHIDALVEVNGKKIGVEVDGPTHFIGRRPTGRTLLKLRQVLNVDGIHIVSVPYWEWNEVKHDSGKKQQYLRSKLDI